MTDEMISINRSGLQAIFDEKRKLIQDFKHLLDTIPLDYNKFGPGNYEFYGLGSKAKWIEWLEKFENLLTTKVPK